MKYLSLVLPLLLTICLSCGDTSRQQESQTTLTEEGYKNITPDQALKQLEDPQVVTLDVRTPEEVGRGYIAGTDMFIDLFGGNFRQELKKLDTSKTYLVYCASGGRSEDASTKMVEMGFKHVENLLGGIENWPGEIVHPDE